MSNDYKFKLGLALAREQELVEQVRILEARLAAATCSVKYDDVLGPFTAMMRNELHANSRKGDREGWQKMVDVQALDEIQHHLHKLRQAVHAREGDAIREHCADVANCAMMVADVCGQLGRP